MPRFEPFPGVRYNPDRVRLAEVVAPPYDVISPSERAQLQSMSPYNSVRIELPDDDPDLDRYEAAARRIARWQSEGVLLRDPIPSLYGYRMTYRDEAGRRRHTIGVIGALGLGPPGTAGIFPHEHTTPKAKSDRLQLLQATRVNTSPIWGLSLAKGLSEALVPPEDSDPVADSDGIEHELWAITDPEAIAWITAAVSAAPVVIADGHHRFETALTYQSQRRAAAGAATGAEVAAGTGAGTGTGTATGGAGTEVGGGTEEEAGVAAGAGGADSAASYDAVLALVVELAEEQLSVLAIHRLVSGLPQGFDVVEALARRFEMTPTAEAGAAVLEQMEDTDSLGLVTPGGSWLLRPKPETITAAQQDLDSSRLAVALDELPPHDLVYQHGFDQALDAVARGEAQAAVLLRPVTVEQIASTGRGGERMPPKTTFFWPKPRTGFVFREVAG